MSGVNPHSSSDLPGDQSPDEQIKDKLRSGGLDPSYWFKVFKDELGVNNLEELEFIGEESYDDLVKHIRKRWEEKALRKFLGMSEQKKQQPKDPDEGIKEKLRSAGLDPSHWLAVFKEELKVSIPEELESIGKESYQDLVKHVRKEREKKPLRKLLGMPEDEESSTKLEREEKRKELRRNQEKAEAMLKQLKELEKEGLDRHESAVKKLEDGVRKALQIDPSTWISNDKSLGELTSSLQVYMEKLSGSLKERNDISDVEVLTSASGGRALRGILVSKRSKDRLKIRERLLRAPSDVQFLFPALAQEDKIDTFASKHKEDKFHMTVERLGYSAATSVKVGYVGVGVELSTSYSHNTEDEVTTKDHKQEQYTSTVKYSFVPMASFLFEDNQLQLSQDALRDLKAIELLSNNPKVSENDLQDNCEEFFLKYGSHANKGDLHFGGIYWWKCYSQGFQKSQMKQVKHLQSQVITASVRASYGPWGVGASVGGDWSQLSANVTGDYSETLKSQTHLHITKTGGPQEVSDLLQWKNGLVASNSTWSVIDRGINAVPVWKIIQINHRTDFKDAARFVQVLLTAWEQMTNLKAKSVLAEVLTIEQEDAKDVLKDVDTWNKSKDPSKCEEYLNELLRIKLNLARSMNPQAWAHHYLSGAPIQQYLKWVVESMQDTSAQHIKLLVQRLVEPSDLNLVKSFPGKHFICKWLNQTDQLPNQRTTECKDLNSLQEFVQKALNMLYKAIAEGNTQGTEETQRQVTCYIAEAVNDLHSHLQLQQQVYDDLFLITLLYPLSYDTNEKFFGRLLSCDDLEYLHKELNDEITEFIKVKSEGLVMKEQAYLFHLAVSFLHSRIDLEFQNMCYDHLQYLQRECKLVPNIKRILTRHSISSSQEYNWAGLQQDLMEVMCMSPDDSQRKPGSNLLKFLTTIQSANKRKVNPQNTQYLTTQHCQKIQNVLDILGVSDYYPQKLTRKHALCIRQQTLESKQFYILEKIMMHNFQYWNCLLKDGTFILHPMDSLLALLLCADNLLRQDLMVKMSTCKLAIPLLLPDPYSQIMTLPLWGMRSIVKEWKCRDISGKTDIMECSMVEHQTPIISFMRFSDSDPDSGKSKSKILNDVIGDSQHNFFFHWDCEGGNAERLLVEGVVEMCWYLPAGKETDSFNEAIAFTNLRGDARNHRKQFQFLRQVSFMNFVLLTQADLSEESITTLKQLSEAPGVLVLMFSDAEAGDNLQKHEALSTIVYKSIKMKRQNLAVIKREIRAQIAGNLQEQRKRDSISQQFKTLIDCSLIAEQIGIVVDENYPECTVGRRLAEEVLQKVQADRGGGSPTGVKHKLLPLQSKELWHAWAQYNKERHRHLNQGYKTTPLYNAEIDDCKDDIRKRQLEECDPPNAMMRSFMSSLLQHKGILRDYFLHWLKLLLDKHSRQSLPPLQSQYDKLKCELQKTSSDDTTGSDFDTEKETIRAKLVEINDQIVFASLGLEHLFRELGQMYESVIEVGVQSETISEVRSLVSYLPTVAAELLITGYPLELMDGDASHVPITWVMAVLDQLQILLKRDGNAQIFALSVLGIQSSGKSTLLNTMFGVKFAVSAGRCTRGAFIQLLQVQNDSKPCDYLLVVDTEGLRAPELDSQKMLKRDNEMAAFVIGLANVTMINIFGETPSDIQDILQTSVHAFLRMKKLELKPSCQFVHQNVTAITADTKLTQGKANLVENLNEMVKYAAKEEQCDDKYTAFDQVMSFDLEKDVRYFPSLWKGDPPMASVNPGYSEKAQDLKLALTTLATTSKSKLSVTAFKKHITALWDAVLRESFVFSFKNMLEMTAYNELDFQHGQWSSLLQSHILTLQTKYKNTVFSSDVSELDGLEKKLTDQSERDIQEFQETLLKEIDKFFTPEKCDHVDIIIQWKEQTRQNFIFLCKKQQDQTDDYCRTLIRNRRDRVSLDNLQKNIYQEIQGPVRKLALQLRGQALEEHELQKEFDKLWLQLKARLLTKRCRKTDTKVEASVESCLKQIFRSKERDKLIDKLSACGGLRKRGTPPIVLEVTKDHIIGPEGWWIVKKVKGLFTEQPQVAAVRQTKAFIKDAEDELNELCSEVREYSENLSFKVLRDIPEYVEKFNQEEKAFSFTEEFKLDLTIAVGAIAVRKFEVMIQENAPVTTFEKMRKPFYVKFVSQYSQRSSETAAAKSLSSYLKESIQIAIIDSLVPQIVHLVRLRDKRFENKYGLLYNIMLDLAKSKSFDAFIMFLSNVEKSLRSWIEKYTMEYCTTVEGQQNRLETLAHSELVVKVQLIVTAAQDVTRSLSEHESLGGWLVKFHQRLKDSFQLNLEEMKQDVGVISTGNDDGATSDFGYFVSEFIASLQTTEEELRVTFKSLHLQMKDWRIRPFDVLADDMIGCCKQCPFCKTKCEYMDPKHPGDHRVSIHRPQCLGGYRWSHTQIMTLDVCTTLVESDNTFKNKDTDKKFHPYRQYRDIYKDWMIKPNASRYDASYWKYFVAHHTDELAEYFGVKKPRSGSDDDKILQGWKKLEWEKVLDELKASFNIQ